MKTEFEFAEKNGGVCVTRVLSPGAVCIIPETIGGLPVSELGDRAFAGSPVEEVFLPPSLKRIGRYGFYNCEKLRALHLYASAAEVGGGVFNGCRNVREIFFHMGTAEQSALRDYVTELNERLTVHYYVDGPDGNEREAACLIFPAYFDEAVENTPARITVSNIHGTGQKYRYCFDDRRLRFEKYDRLFVYEKAEEPLLSAAEIAAARLRLPYGLNEEGRKAYTQFIRENLPELLFGTMDKPDTFKWLLAEFGEKTLDAAGLDHLIREASEKKRAELSGILMDMKHRNFPPVKKKFEF